jgi:hypothetical protein
MPRGPQQKCLIVLATGAIQPQQGKLGAMHSHRPAARWLPTCQQVFHGYPQHLRNTCQIAANLAGSISFPLSNSAARNTHRLRQSSSLPRHPNALSGTVFK